MKAEVRKTGKVVNVYPSLDAPGMWEDINTRDGYSPYDLDFVGKHIDPERRRYELTKSALLVAYMRLGNVTIRDIVKEAVDIADEVLKQLNKNGEK